MPNTSHLWAVGYDHADRAAQVRRTVIGLAGPEEHLRLLDIVVVVRSGDGSFALDRESITPAKKGAGHGLVALLASFTLAAPALTSDAVDAIFGPAGLGVVSDLGIEEAFIRDVESLMKPATSALFVLDEERDMETTLSTIRGLGGTILRTNVDADRARLIQSTLKGGFDQFIRPAK
jgi:uncharacterized membrane protein